MKNFLKKYLKFVLGIAAILLVIFLFIQSQKNSDLESRNLNAWRNASVDNRIAAVKILIATEDNVDLIVQCVDKIASLPDSSEMTVRDATELCFMGTKLKNNI